MKTNNPTFRDPADRSMLGQYESAPMGLNQTTPGTTFVLAGQMPIRSNSPFTRALPQTGKGAGGAMGRPVEFEHAGSGCGAASRESGGMATALQRSPPAIRTLWRWRDQYVQRRCARAFIAYSAGNHSVTFLKCRFSFRALQLLLWRYQASPFPRPSSHCIIRDTIVYKSDKVGSRYGTG